MCMREIIRVCVCAEVCAYVCVCVVPALDTVAGVAVRRWLISNTSLMVGFSGMRSLLARVSTCGRAPVHFCSTTQKGNVIIMFFDLTLTPGPSRNDQGFF